tara:strand:- start:6337 stop:6606 length:270 start_codon:yes stop_codon:yes gene_type:complete
MNSYSLINTSSKNKKPLKSIPNKRTKTNKGTLGIKNIYNNSFEYLCFRCNKPQTLSSESSELIEIECEDCGCRIFRKPRVQKNKVILAI